MRFTYEEIKNEIANRLKEFESQTEPGDLLREEADSLTPVYNSEIIADWAEMPSEFENSWREYGWDESLEQGGILGLMRIDLVHYYTSLTLDAYAELTEGARPCEPKLDNFYR
jgi:hypothetical protein